MSEPPLKITVATVTYNAAELINKTIASVEAQDYPYVEHVIVDGNSTDNTLEVVHHYQERNSVASVPHEINCISEPDKGLYDAMNKAIDMATGHYIVFINAGDVFHETTTLSKVVAAAERYGKSLPAVVYGNTDIVDEEGNFIRHRRLAPPERLTWRSFRSGMLVCHQAFFARTDLARQFHYDLRYRFSADFDWCIRIMHNAKRLKAPLCNAHVIVADYLNEGTTTRNHKASLRERFTIMRRHYGIVVTLWMHAWFTLRNFILK